MVQLFVRQFDLPLRHVFTISRGSIEVQKTLIVELRDGSYRGYGEATVNEYYGATMRRMITALARVRHQVETSGWDDPTTLWDEVHPTLRNDPFAQCALDEAAHDLWGKRHGAPVYRLWGLNVDRVPVSNYTLGIDTIEVMVRKLEEMSDWPIYKIKLGTPEDLQIVRQLRQHTTARFRVDANGAWTVEETLANAAKLKKLDVEFIEQPLPADDWAGQKQLYEKSPLPIIADESCQKMGDVERCSGYFHGVNIKLVKCGGLTPARRMIQRARELDLKVMAGCMTESTVGISALAQLLPLLDYVDMDGATLLARDIATGVRLERGQCIFPEENGTGVQLIGDRS